MEKIKNLILHTNDMNRLLFFTLGIAFFAVAGRFFPHLPNFTPVGALALFAGVYIAPKTKWALCLPLAVLFLSDLKLSENSD